MTVSGLRPVTSVQRWSAAQQDLDKPAMRCPPLQANFPLHMYSKLFEYYGLYQWKLATCLKDDGQFYRLLQRYLEEHDFLPSGFFFFVLASALTKDWIASSSRDINTSCILFRASSFSFLSILRLSPSSSARLLFGNRKLTVPTMDISCWRLFRRVMDTTSYI